MFEALHEKGLRHVKGVDVRQITAQGQVSDKGQVIDCDLLCMSAGYMPVYQLLCQAGGKLAYEDSRAEFSLSGLPQNLNVAGSVHGRHQLDNVLADASNAAHDIALALGLSPAAARTPLRSEAQVNFNWPIFPHPKGKDFVDFDEDLQVADIVNATRIGYRDVQLVKRYSTVGMGPSQGRHSALPTARLVAWATQRNISETGVTTARPPFVAEKLAHVAGRAFDPYRQTPMHARHLQAGRDDARRHLAAPGLLRQGRGPRRLHAGRSPACAQQGRADRCVHPRRPGRARPGCRRTAQPDVHLRISQAAGGPFALCADDQ